MWEIETNDDINIREEKMRMRNRNIESKTDIFVKKIVNLYEKQKARTTIRRKNCLIHVDSYEESLWEKGRHLGGKNIDKSVWERRRIIFSGLAGYATLDDGRRFHYGCC